MRRKRTLWVILLAVPLLAVGADTIYWQLAERRLESNLALWLAGQQAAGWTATTGAAVRGGWPFAATLTLPQVLLKGGTPDIPGGLTWSSERLELRVNLLRPVALTLTPEGMQRVSLAGGPEFSYTAERLRATLPLQAAAVPSWVTISASNLRVVIQSGTDAPSTLAIGQLELHADLKPEAAAGAPALAIALRAETIDPPSGIARLLGPRIASITVDGALDGPLPGMRPMAERAAAWRDGGGSLEIQKLTLTWGPLDLSAGVTLALDDELQPMGAGTAHIVGYAETLDTLAAHGMLSRSASTAAKAVLSLLAHAPDDGSPPDVDVPLTLQYRTLAMRQVPLFRLPEVSWPGPP